MKNNDVFSKNAEVGIFWSIPPWPSQIQSRHTELHQHVPDQQVQS